jgi:glutaminyl-tRNA synthetase
MKDIYTRFPPEPNGFLHIGHLKAMLFDFNYHPNAKCYLRLDDTNPDKESQLFVDGIVEDVQWMGFTPYKITYTSDYFNILYDYAIKLIKNNLAYVDFSTDEEIKHGRREGIESKYRNMNINFNLDEFKKMKNGIYDENTCTLRLKIDMNNSNHVLRDPIAYRIKKSPHYKT